MTKLEQAKEISCESILQESGFDLKRLSGGKKFFLCPWRAEGEPSLVVFTNNKWKDFGSGDNGDAIDLYERIYNVDTSSAIKKMLDEEFEEFEQKDVVDEPGVIIENIQDLTSSTLSAYLKSERKIDPDLARIYCKELHVRFPKGKYPNKIHKAIGFGNDRGGWEFRNNYLKLGTSPKYYTRIKNGFDECAVFEGWIDFLTLLMWVKKDGLDKDVFVFNSTSFLDFSIPVLKSYSMNHFFLDNDETGKRVTKTLKDSFVWGKNYSERYGEYNDLNEWWCR